MNKTELKKMLKPLIKECIKEVVFEEGTISTIVKEVLAGSSANVVKETQAAPKPPEAGDQQVKRLYERKKKLLDEIGNSAFNGVDIFEGTKPAPPPQQAGSKVLADVDPNDSGVDISAFAGKSKAMWQKMSGK